MGQCQISPPTPWRVKLVLSQTNSREFFWAQTFDIKMTPWELNYRKWRVIPGQAWKGPPGVRLAQAQNSPPPNPSPLPQLMKKWPISAPVES